MKMNRIKGLLWLGAFGVGGGLVYYVADFLRHKAELEQMLPQEVQKAVLDDVPQPPVEERDLVAVESITSIFFDMDWTGKAPPAPVVKAEGAKPPEPPKMSVAELLKVLFVQMDSDDPEGGATWVEYKPGKGVDPTKVTKAQKFLRVGDALARPHQGISVKAVTGEGVVFQFSDGREPELVHPLGFPEGGGGIVVVRDGEALQVPTSPTRIHSPTSYRPFRPEVTTQTGKNEYLLGTESIQQAANDYSRILSQDLRYQTYRSPRTGQVEGVQITHVTPGSLPANHGISKGEILKSINGHKVTSPNDAIAFVKANADTTETWVAVFEKQGKEFTRVYRSPPPD